MVTMPSSCLASMCSTGPPFMLRARNSMFSASWYACSGSDDLNHVHYQLQSTLAQPHWVPHCMRTKTLGAGLPEHHNRLLRQLPVHVDDALGQAVVRAGRVDGRPQVLNVEGHILLAHAGKLRGRRKPGTAWAGKETENVW